MNLRTLAQSLTVTGLTLFHTLAHAHPGHDHSHWASNAIHALVFVSVLAAVGASLFFAARRKVKQESTEG